MRRVRSRSMPAIASNCAEPRMQSRARWPRSALALPRRCSQSICTKRSTPSMNYLVVAMKKQYATPFSGSFASANDANDSLPQMIYERFLRPLLFALDPETAHHFALAICRVAAPLLPKATEKTSPVSVFGLNFHHRVGLAAGLDKNGVALSAWEALGFSFVELGTVTAQAQPGNPRPRIFRYPKERALINRLGFNNDGAETIANRLAELRDRGGWPRIPVGINIGKSRVTPIERAVEDYLFSFRKLRAQADYIALNVSSPNTLGLRELQGGQRLDELLRAINAERGNMPLLVKIAPDLEPAALDEIVSVCEASNSSGIIATNNTPE